MLPSSLGVITRNIDTPPAAVYSPYSLSAKPRLTQRGCHITCTMRYKLMSLHSYTLAETRSLYALPGNTHSTPAQGLVSKKTLSELV